MISKCLNKYSYGNLSITTDSLYRIFYFTFQRQSVFAVIDQCVTMYIGTPDFIIRNFQVRSKKVVQQASYYLGQTTRKTNQMMKCTNLVETLHVIRMKHCQNRCRRARSRELFIANLHFSTTLFIKHFQLSIIYKL